MRFEIASQISTPIYITTRIGITIAAIVDISDKTACNKIPFIIFFVDLVINICPCVNKLRTKKSAGLINQYPCFGVFGVTSTKEYN